MDLSLLDNIPDSPLFEAKNDPFSHDSDYLFLQNDPFTSDTLPLSDPVPVKDELVLDPFEASAMPVANNCSLPTPPPSALAMLPPNAHQPSRPPEPPSPLQENRPANARPKVKKRVVKRPVPSVKKEPLSPDARNKDKLAQRKLRNKESARRYREKQVARRRQLENYTRSLTEQNRELEIIHDKLLRLTCERRSAIDTIDAINPPLL